MNLEKLGEFGLIDRLARQLAECGVQPRAGEVTLGIGDDAAVLRIPPGRELVATIDALVEEVHFRREWSRPEDVGWKALAVNVSDLGAMGAEPLAAVITLALPVDLPVRWVDRLYSGLAECAAAYGCPLAGGDTVRAPLHVGISVAALGTVPAGRAVHRSGARAGDLVCVTGVLGDSAAGLALLERGEKPRRGDTAALIQWHRRPRPPVEAGAALAAAALPAAMLDLSDGLASDLDRIAEASGVGARIEADRLPISDAARVTAAGLKVDPVDWALHGGEDYQLLFAVSPERWPRVPPTLGPFGVAATVIGEVTRTGLLLRHPDGRSSRLRPRGFKHFAREAPGKARKNP